ncbi:hypothetical protein AAT17_10285 [Nonlabens sp. MIC269]|uniref:hypothetical protein n=1 Tax=Nonlabens sp. MIC269 TaxID=1476901 RepID=UPI000720EB49|nr:hypothetical protein [Nonlabens sp. MIC269]ALM21594.1 hypothetical protein AAT17_10285 [Nonlabens sp. MIC269]
MKSYLIGLILVLFSLLSSAQNYEYMGLLKLPDSSLITYNLSFKEENGKIKGFSYSDMNGEHETKSAVVGKYDSEENKLEFREVEIIYTKSNIKEIDFCNVYFTGDLRKLNGKAEIKGTFKGFYDDLTSCIDGELVMQAAEKVKKRNEKFQKRVNRTNKVPDSIKQKINMSKMFNRFSKNQLKGGENLNIILKDKNIKLIIWDDQEADGDKIELSINDRKILKDFEPSTTKKIIPLEFIDPVNTIKIKALNIGNKPPNTAKIAIEAKDGQVIDVTSQLKVGEDVTFTFFKEKPKIQK